MKPLSLTAILIVIAAVIVVIMAILRTKAQKKRRTQNTVKPTHQDRKITPAVIPSYKTPSHFSAVTQTMSTLYKHSKSLDITTGLHLILTDTLVRWRQMQGSKTLWLPDTSLGINPVSKNSTRSINSEPHKIKPLYQQQSKQLGISLDWSKPHLSTDERVLKSSQTAFIKLYNAGLIYRDKCMVQSGINPEATWFVK